MSKVLYEDRDTCAFCKGNIADEEGLWANSNLDLDSIRHVHRDCYDEFHEKGIPVEELEE